MPAMKEPHYFSRLEPMGRMRYPISHISDGRQYLRLFAPAGDRIAVGEASSSYLWEVESARRIQQVSPRAKIIIMLRDPLARAYSHYLMDVREGWNDLSFFDALQRDWHSPEKGYGISRLYVELGLYCDQVKTYLNTFGAGPVRIIHFEEFTESLGRGDPWVLEEIEDFLGLDHARPDAWRLAQDAGNHYAQARFNWTRRLAGNAIVRRLGNALVPPSFGSTFMLKRRFYEPIFLNEAAKPPIDPRAKRWLCEIFDRDLASLETLLGRRLPDLRKSW